MKGKPMSSSNGVSKNAFGNYGTANGLASGYDGAAAGNSSILTPTLNRMAVDPQGYSPATMAGFNTAAQQGAGGGAAATVGQANLEAARTNNAGAFAPVATQAGHDATAQLSDAALGVQNQNAQLKEQQRQEGISGLQNMYNTNVGAGENALGLSNQSLGVANEGDNSAFKRNMALWNSGAALLGAA
jgi:hypothetical protein